MRVKTFNHLLLIALSYVILILLVNPAGDFPVNDDWAYARSVLSLVEDGEFHLLDWGAMTLITQVLWGSLWVKLFGFSFEVLRFSTIFLGFIALAGCYFIILCLGKKTWIATTGTLVLMVNPLFLVLSNSFMTDVPFLALSTWSAYFMLRAIEEDSVPHLLPGICLAVAALLLRQIALALPLAFLIAYAARNSRAMSMRRLLVSITPLAIGSITYIAYIRWLKINDNLPHAMIWSQERLYENFLGLFDGEYADLVFYLSSAGSMLLYLGLFSLPMMFALYLRRGNERFLGMKTSTFWTTAGVLFSVITIALLANHALMPVRGNVLTIHGIGPFTLRDVYALELLHLFAIAPTVLQFVTALSVLGALLLVHGLAMTLRSFLTIESKTVRENLVASWREIFLLTLMAVYLAPLILTDYFDRYLLFLLPFIFALVAVRADMTQDEQPPFLKISSLLLIPVFGLFSLALAHDYMNWNRIRLEATNWVITEYQADHSSIDSGFELNGFYGYDHRYHNDQANWVRDDKYVVGFGSVPGHAPVKRFELEQLLSIGPREIIVSRRPD